MAKESAEEKLLKMMQKSSPSVAVKPSVPSLSKRNSSSLSAISALNTFLFLGIIACIVALVFEMRSGFSLLNQAVEFPAESKTECFIV